MTPKKRIRVLSIGDDDGIRYSRALVLRQEGYEVETMLSSEALNPERIRSFHIAILCHTVLPRRAAEIAEILRKYNPDIAVLRVHAIRSTADHFYDVDCEVFPGPGQLLEGMQTLSARFQPPAASESPRYKRA